MATVVISGIYGFQPLYLHFLDRELRDSLKTTIAPATIEFAIRTLLMGTPGMLYCALSPAWEGTTDSVARFISGLLTVGQIDTVSNHASVDEFLTAKRVQYEHDSNRYPMYFGAGQEVRQNLRTTQFKRSSATDALAQKLDAWAYGGSGPSVDRYYLTEIEPKLKQAVRESLAGRLHKAITYSMFDRELAKQGLEKNPLAVGAIRREISTQYVAHYTDFAAGDISTGIAGFDYFDANARLFPLHDIEFFNAIFRRVGLTALATGASAEDWDIFLALRGEFVHRELAMQIRVFLAGCFGFVPAELPSRFGQRSSMRDALQRCLYSCRLPAQLPVKVADIMLCAFNLLTTAIDVCSNHKLFADEASKMRDAMKQQQQRVLLVTATQVEIETAIELMGQGFSRDHIGDHTYYKLGELGGCQIIAVKSSMGSGGPSGSQATVADALREINPSAVVMVGIAFGMKRDEQKIGDILISRQLTAYEPERRGRKDGKPGNIPRGPRVDVPPRMLDRFESGKLDWKGSAVHSGLILCGDKLVDSAEFKEYLLDIEPEAIGGEMEGAGLYAAAFKGKADWIVVKAIADWGEGKGDEAQHKAAGNAVKFVIHVLSKGGLAIGAR